MKHSPDLLAIREAGLISEQQFQSISEFLSKRAAPASQAPRFDLTHVLWYAGALITICALGIFTDYVFNRLGSKALIACGVVYAIGFGVAGHILWHRQSLRIPGGLLIAVATAMVPVIAYGIQDFLQLWDYAGGHSGNYRNAFPYVSGTWLYIEIATVIAAAIAVYFYRFSFILAIAAVALWFMSMDIALWFTRTPYPYHDYPVLRTTSMIFGIAMILVAWIMDLRRKDGNDMSFWLHVFGVMAFWGGLSLYDGGTTLTKFIYLLINLGLLGLSLFLNRRIYAVAGAMGITGYLGYLASNVFRDSILFPLALSAIGLAIIVSGIFVHRNRERLVSSFGQMLPEPLKKLRP